MNARIVFVQHGATLSSEDNLLEGTRNEELSTLGDMQANKAAELLMDLKVDTCSLSTTCPAPSHAGCQVLGALNTNRILLCTGWSVFMQPPCVQYG